MENHIKEFLLKADSKALATYGLNGLNVVPVSTIFIQDDNVILVDYFMDKTVKNILENSYVSIAAWKDLFGYQLKCVAKYKKEGEVFEDIKEKVKEILPDRIVKGIIILTVREIYDIAPNKDTKDQLV